MPKLSVCIEMFWPGTPCEERIPRVAGLGYGAFEFWGWKNKDLAAVREAGETHGIPIAALSLEPTFSLIRRGALADLVQGMRDTARVAKEFRFDRQHPAPVIIATTGNTYDDESYEISRRRVVRHLAALGKVAEDNGLVIVLEPLNTLVDHHGYYLTTMAQAVDIVQEVDCPAVKILMDLYHEQIQEGNLINNLTAYAPYIGHYHVAGVPGRHEPLGGEVDYRGVLRAIDATGYHGYVGLEYRPLLDPEESLRQTLALAQG